MASYKHIPFKPPKELKHLQVFDTQSVLSGNTDCKKRLLIVLDYVPTEDLRFHKLLGNSVGATFKKMIAHTVSKYNLDTDLEDYDYLITSFHMAKTAGLADEIKEAAKTAFGERLDSIITDFKPHMVVAHGYDPFKHLAKAQLTLTNGEHNGWLGQVVPCSVTSGPVTHKFKLCYNLSVHQILNPLSLKNTAYLLGMMSDFYLPVFDGHNRYHIPDVKTGDERTFKIKYVTTIKEFNSLMDKLHDRKIVAIDTETNSLNRVVTILQCMQFSYDGKTAFVVPYHHKDSPWTAKEIKHIRKRIRFYFERNENIYQVYTNAKFDLNVMRGVFNIRHYKANVWDIIAGESVYDENAKLLRTVTGTGFMNLKNLSMYYGTRAYYTTAFGKEKRATIHQVPMDDGVLEYCSLDVIIPYWIFRSQLQRAEDIGYDKYEMMVGTQLADQIHSFSILESNGALCDVEYLFKLSLPTSPINAEIEKLEKEFYESRAVKRASAIIAKNNHIPTEGLFGSTVTNVFKLGDNEHKQILFFDVMQLEPVSVSDKLRKNGKPFGKIDKQFQAKYKSNPIVEMFTGISKAYKLRNAYVKSLIKLYGTSEDFRSDKRIRPNYNYDKVVTGRSSADNPKLTGLHESDLMSKAA